MMFDIVIITTCVAQTPNKQSKSMKDQHHSNSRQGPRLTFKKSFISKWVGEPDYPNPY